jgi:hypothetical protein
MRTKQNYRKLWLLSGVLQTVALFGQYPGSAGQAGTTAMKADSSAFVAWASQSQVHRGYQDISTPSLGLASAGADHAAEGLSDGTAVSLGDAGWVVCTFQNPIRNGNGPDFAVFENSFSDDFLELAVVEVSSDGVNYTRFKAHSLTDTTVQTASFGLTDATKLNNLAGKYRGGYGTPFDLQELAGTPGLNINAITHVKVIDVVGSINKPYATYDGFGNKINDPWPTAFPSGGFDLDAIGVINQAQGTSTGLSDHRATRDVLVFPNPVSRGEKLELSGATIEKMQLCDEFGGLVKETNETVLNTREITPGIYFLRVVASSGTFVKKLIVQ